MEVSGPEGYVSVVLAQGYPARLLATLEFKSLDGSQDEDCSIPCSCQVDSGNVELVYCEFRQQVPSASIQRMSRAVFRPSQLQSEENVKRQVEALKVHAGPQSNDLAPQITELFDAFEWYVCLLGAV